MQLQILDFWATVSKYQTFIFVWIFSETGRMQNARLIQEKNIVCQQLALIPH